MQSFIKYHSSLIGKFILNQIALTLFGLVLYLSTYKITWLALFSSVFAILFYYFLLMITSVEFANKEKIKIDSGRAPYNPLYGLYASLCANALNIILAVAVLLGKLFTDVQPDAVVNGIFDKISVAGDLMAQTPAWSYRLLVICQPIFNILNGMYMGVINTFAPQNSAAFLLILLPSLAVCWFGYYSGVKGLKIARIFDMSGKPKA